MRLFIAEKPSLARAIADVLPKPHRKGDGFIECAGECNGGSDLTSVHDQREAAVCVELQSAEIVCHVQGGIESDVSVVAAGSHVHADGQQSACVVGPESDGNIFVVF